MATGGDELGALEADLRGVAVEAGPNIEKAIRVTAHKVMEDWRSGATVGRGYAKSYAASIGYDMVSASVFGQGVIEAEIGPELRRTPGASAGFLEDAPGGVQSAPQHAGRDALEKNQRDFVDGIGIAIVDTLGDHNF